MLRKKTWQKNIKAGKLEFIQKYRNAKEELEKFIGKEEFFRKWMTNLVKISMRKGNSNKLNFHVAHKEAKVY